MTPIKSRAPARFAVVLLAALGIVLMHGVSTDHAVMRISLPAGHMTIDETTPGAPVPHAQGAPVAGIGDATMTMNHAPCLAVVRTSEVAPHILATHIVVLAAGVETLKPDFSKLGRAPPRPAPPPDLATELCISRT